MPVTPNSIITPQTPKQAANINTTAERRKKHTNIKKENQETPGFF